MLKVYAQPATAVEPVAYTFQFTSATRARAEADALRDALSKAIQAAKADQLESSAPGGGSSASIAIAGAVASKARDSTQPWEDDERLVSNIELQQSLLKANGTLSKTFMESLRQKPDSMSTSQFTRQFWSSRLNLLRSHAIERSQSKGAYNILSTIKSRTEDNVSKLNITREQINLIFSQHPLVKRVYDENVPKLSEEAFWSRFFQSRLLKKLKGERITDADSKDALLDKYLNTEEDLERAKRLMGSHVPNIINVEGNEQNHSQRKGNAPDLWMRPTAVEKVPIIRTLNSLSEKILSHVTPNDVDPSQPIGIDEETFNALALRDLQGDPAENRVMLSVRDQSRFFSSGKDSDEVGEGYRFEVRNPKELRKALAPSLRALAALDLREEIGTNDESSDSDSEREDTESKHMGSRVSMRASSAQVLAAISQQRESADEVASGAVSSERTAAYVNLSPTVYDRICLTHATTTEFLHHFWVDFLSGDPSKAEEVRKLVETLDRAMSRINAVAEDAEAERKSEIEKEKRRIRDYFDRTHKKLRFDESALKGPMGGAETVKQLMAPTVEAIGVASKKFAEALAEAESAT